MVKYGNSEFQNNLKTLSTEKAREIGAKGRQKFGYSKT